MNRKENKTLKCFTCIEIGHELLQSAGFQEGKHSLSDIQCMTPIVIFHWSIIFLDAENPSTKNLYTITGKITMSWNYNKKKNVDY